MMVLIDRTLETFLQETILRLHNTFEYRETKAAVTRHVSATDDMPLEVHIIGKIRIGLTTIGKMARLALDVPWGREYRGHCRPN